MQKKDFNFSMQNRPRLRLQALTCVGGRGSGCQCHQLTTLLLNLCRSPAADKEVNYHMLKWQCDQQACKQSLPRERSDAPPDESNVQPHLWMWVNPNVVCPTARHLGTDATEDRSLSSSTAADISFSSPSPSLDYSNLDCSEEDLLSSASEAGKFTEDEDAASVDIQLSQKMVETPKFKANLAPWKAKVSRSRSRKLKYTLQAKAKTKEIWPRPPLNYCILITLALYNSAEGSLTVQQIYQFTRHHFPFFQTAPDGWKNTIRHNLCFSRSFEKTTRFVCSEGKRKARLWKLTTDGRRKFEEEMQALPTEALALVHQSMNEPGTVQREQLLSEWSRQEEQSLETLVRELQLGHICACRALGKEQARLNG
ncbi:forkhead box protein R1 isoform X2 [Alligator mississippiensis]|uniref:forkhead box protein R1 isoform X2 n=1 Tax=Alligator mississippiensis TaxID=8496 RepID=UPI00287793D7|nr:forkhead box protein R1 isoform X2 [Alligator mississippiensis]